MLDLGKQAKVKMSHEAQGPGLRDAFDVLVKTPSQRLLSLTMQLGESPEESIVHALCLIVLQREEQALKKLQMLRDNSIAKYLTENLKTSGGTLQDLEIHCGSFQELTRESLATLARIFKVLSEKRLCDSLKRDLAYKRVISSDLTKTGNGEDQGYDQIKEEAKDVCGPEFAEWMCSWSDVKSESDLDPQGSLVEGNSTLKVAGSQHTSVSLPSPLQTSLSEPSYPTHLEISIAPTVSFQGDKISPQTSETPKLNPPEQLQLAEPKPTGSPLFGAKTDSKMDGTLMATSHTTQTPDQTQKPSIEARFALPTATKILEPATLTPAGFFESKGAEDFEEDIFYAFVILHAPDDADMAESMKEKLEEVIGFAGATFADEFALPGKSTLKCVEDAINNSAYTFLLLTRNFNSRMLEMKTNTALINSINNRHKYNTVIPLLPRENCMPKQCIPLILQTLVPLEENRSFEKKLKRSLSTEKIERQRKIWTKEQEQKILQQKSLNQRDNDNLNRFLQQNCCIGASGSTEDGGDGRVWWQQQPNIHIENAKYIMIGNDSRMSVDLGGSTDNKDSLDREEGQ
ncbi:TIR domain-containing adapter molecule 1 [Mugil cephalus]|uniref:TIR domain-containing adapter molecule 1 n=1 Tax=Mugil cephalus TaxID=48193 RepID=UPI001FB669E9|nr:TIR domain-containing adapter molecule 1 [Mugil cephalus]